MKQERTKEQKQIFAFGLSEEGISCVSVTRDNEDIPTLAVFEFFPGDKGVHSIILKQLAKQHKIRKFDCATCLNHSDYQLITAEAPSVPEEDLINALRWSIKDSLNIPIDDATLDTFEVPNQTSTKKNINIVSAKKVVIEDLNSLFAEAKLNLNIIDIEELAIRNLAILDEHEKDGIVILWLKENSGKILFIREKNLYLSRNIELGYESIRSSEIGLENIALEIQRSVDYFERHFSQIPMKRLIIMPTMIELPDLFPFLNQNLSISCHDYELKNILSSDNKLTNDDIAKHLVTFGTALRHESDDQ